MSSYLPHSSRKTYSIVVCERNRWLFVNAFGLFPSANYSKVFKRMVDSAFVCDSELLNPSGFPDNYWKEGQGRENSIKARASSEARKSADVNRYNIYSGFWGLGPFDASGS